MDSLTLSADTIGRIHYLYKHLMDRPTEHPTDVPKYTAFGEKVTELKDVSALMGIDTKVAAVYVLQDPSAAAELKSEATEVLNPGIFVATDDSYLPVVHKAFSLLTSAPTDIEKKRIRMVRTVNGVRRFKQKRGTIIVDDGESPLDALVALPNDVPGYEKVADKQGNSYYIGRENGKWVVRDPRSTQVIRESKTEEDAFRWLNQKAGGTNETRARGKQVEENDKPISTGRKERETSDRVLTDEQVTQYTRLRKRGLSHKEALLLVRKSRAKAKAKR